MKRVFVCFGILFFLALTNLCSGSTTTGSIVAWGYNQYNQCRVPSSDTNFIAVAAGSQHSFALRGDGSIAIWGWNKYGQSPATSSNLHFTAISAGGVFSLGLNSDGKILAAGDNRYGECNVPDPNFVYLAISAGNYHALALKSDGSVVAWGYNGNGQCDVPEPNSGFVAVSAGYIHSLALKSDGSIVAWGDNSAGQCDVPSPNRDFIAIAGGGQHSLGLKANGYVVAWGDNNDHQCRVPSSNTGFVAIAAGFAHSLALKADGSIRGWGWNDYGQRDVDACAPDSNYVAIAAGFGHSLALRSTCDIPSRPAGVSASDGLYPDHIRVSWNHVSKADSYELWRSSSNIPASASKLGDFNSPYNDYNIPSDSRFYYWVRAVNTCGTSFFSKSNSGFTSLNPTTHSILIRKCSVAADNSDNNDMISISGLMNAEFNDVNNADVIEVNIYSDDINTPCVQTFPIDGNTFKNGRFRCSQTFNSLKTSFVFNTKTSKFSFTAKNIDLSGLTCPFNIRIEIGSFIVESEVNEAVVNGPRRPIPINLLMGLRDSLRIDKFKVKSSSSNTGWLSAKGGFSVSDVDVNMADSNFIVTLSGQAFTIPLHSFRENKDRFTCSNIKLSDGSIASADFNFRTCVFTLTIKKANISAASGPADFSIDFAEFSETAEVLLP